MIRKIWLRRLAYLAAVGSFTVAAILAGSDDKRPALTLIAVGGACLSFAVWWSARVLHAGSVDLRQEMRKLRRGFATGSMPDSTDDDLSARVERVESGLRDLPVIAQQSVVITEAVAALRTEIDALRADLERRRDEH